MNIVDAIAYLREHGEWPSGIYNRAEVEAALKKEDNATHGPDQSNPQGAVQMKCTMPRDSHGDYYPCDKPAVAEWTNVISLYRNEELIQLCEDHAFEVHHEGNRVDVFDGREIAEDPETGETIWSDT